MMLREYTKEMIDDVKIMYNRNDRWCKQNKQKK